MNNLFFRQAEKLTIFYFYRLLFSSITLKFDGIKLWV